MDRGHGIVRGFHPPANCCIHISLIPTTLSQLKMSDFSGGNFKGFEVL
jgi:hypothetical protein